MVKITNDDQAVELIAKLLNFKFKDEEESSEILISLQNYQDGIAEIITSEKYLLSPEGIIKLAREKNKPILL